MYKIAKENKMFVAINSDDFVVAEFESKVEAERFVKANNLMIEQYEVLNSYNRQDELQELLAEALKEF